MVLEGEDHRVVRSLEWRGGNSFHCILKTNGRTCKLSHFDGRIWQFHYLEEYFCAHGFSVSENDLIVVLSLSVPTIQLDTTRSGQQDLEKERQSKINGPWVTAINHPPSWPLPAKKILGRLIFLTIGKNSSSKNQECPSEPICLPWWKDGQK